MRTHHLPLVALPQAGSAVSYGTAQGKRFGLAAIKTLAVGMLAFLSLSSAVANQYSKTSSDAPNAWTTRDANKITYHYRITTPGGRVFDTWLRIDYADGLRRMKDVYGGLNHAYRTGSTEINKFITSDPFGPRALPTLAQLLRDETWRVNHELLTMEEQEAHAVSEWDVALQFVQSLPYQEGMGHYQRYAVETLIDAAGDCSDTAVLFAAIVREWGIHVAFMSSPGHLAVGLAVVPKSPGPAWPYEYTLHIPYRGPRSPGGSETGSLWMHYAETTGYGWRVGEVPQGISDVGMVWAFER